MPLRRDLRISAFFVFLYMFQGFAFGTHHTATLYLKKNGFDYADIAIMTLSGLPFSLKLFPGILCDSLSLPGLGRRKTWALVGHLIMASAFAGLYVYFDAWVDEVKVYNIGVALFLMYTGAAIQDVTTDGWILERLSPENVRFAGPVQSLGIKLGVAFGFSFFTMLENKFELVTLTNWFFLVSCLLVLSCVLILFCVDELSEKSEAVELQEKDELKPMSNDVKHLSPWSITKTLIGELFFKRNIRIFALVIFIFCISKGTIAHGNLFSIKIQDLGFDRAYLGQISLALIPVQFLTVIGLAPFVRRPLRVIVYFTVPAFGLYNIFGSAIIGHYDYLTEKDLTYYSVMALTALEFVAGTAFYIGLTSFFASKVDGVIGATYMATLWTVTNLSGLITDTAMTQLVGVLEDVNWVDNWSGFHYISVISLFVLTLWSLTLAKYACRLDDSDKSEWTIEGLSKVELK